MEQQGHATGGSGSRDLKMVSEVAAEQNTWRTIDLAMKIMAAARPREEPPWRST